MHSGQDYQLMGQTSLGTLSRSSTTSPRMESWSALTAHYPPHCWALCSHLSHNLIVILIGIQPAVAVEVIFVLGQSVHQSHLE